MVRSFTDRVFGGVCGGLGASIRVNPWILRAAFVVLAAASLGVFALFYIALWWFLPQQSLTQPTYGGSIRFIMVVFLAAAFTLIWVGRDQGWLSTPDGQSIYWPVLLLLMSLVFVARQLKV